LEMDDRLERSDRSMPVAYCCHQFKNWWLQLFSPKAKMQTSLVTRPF